VVKLGQVFNEATFPTVTYIEPREARFLRASLDTPGKHITLIGPSGSGKTTLARRSIAEVGLDEADLLVFSGRSHPGALSLLEVLADEIGEAAELDSVMPYLESVRLIVIDDVHHLSGEAKQDVAETLKLWHERGVRMLLIGIASTGEEIVGRDAELALRNDVFELGVQDEQFCDDLISAGEEALNVRFAGDTRSQIVAASKGIPSVVQAICRNACIVRDVSEKSQEQVEIDIGLPDLREHVLRTYHPKYFDRVVGLAKGKRQARSVHDTYYDIVERIAATDALEIPQEQLYSEIVGVIDDPQQKNRKSTSFYNCLRNLDDVIAEKGLSDVLMYNKRAKTISIEDPAFRFYLNLLDMADVKAQIHVRQTGYQYDVAVSFAGEDRAAVIDVVRAMEDRGLLVFYDFDKEAQLWGKDLRAVLSDVYANQAQFMMVFLSPTYPEKDWPSFEFEVGKAAAGKRTEEYLLPVITDAEVPAMVGMPGTVGRVSLLERTPDEIADLMAEKVDSAAEAARD
jgi:hypothetical protein